MRLLLVRHGQSEWNASRRLQGQADIGLSSTGMQQAEALRPVIAAIGPCRAVASDLKRVRQTADLIGAGQARATQDLREIDVGDWTGRPIDEILAEDEAAYLGWRAGTVTPPGGEAWEDFTARIAEVIERERVTPCANLLVVCHGGVIRAILQRLLGLDPARIVPVGPASLTAVRLNNGRDKPARLELFNFLPGGPAFEAPD